ncbi:hypothetical protein N8I77_010378 [Diaporthe amygdali]|uniref:Uncharacterized protein n=1 Tax=Phomopsis amygdali TaxID=1214568 RepID=A0AAD9S6V9_PHOAM|nr:hypothetical protein N8I77_010378 [Diaporthe amygdali]
MSEHGFAQVAIGVSTHIVKPTTKAISEYDKSIIGACHVNTIFHRTRARTGGLFVCSLAAAGVWALLALCATGRGWAGLGGGVVGSSRSPGLPPLIFKTMFNRLLRSECCAWSLVAAYKKCSDDERSTAQKDMMSDAYHDAGPNQWIVSGIGHEKEPMTAAASRLPWVALVEGGDFDID